LDGLDVFSNSSVPLLHLLLPSLGFSAVICQSALKKEGETQRKGEGEQEEKLSSYEFTLVEVKGKLTGVRMHLEERHPCSYT